MQITDIRCYVLETIAPEAGIGPDLDRNEIEKWAVLVV